MERDINRTEIDGVPVFWADVPGPRLAALAFGVGRSSEPAAMGGVTHLVEHLALAPLAQQDFPHNGFVAGWRTVLHASGTDEELVGFFGRVTGALSALPVDRLPMERRILRQEGVNRDPGIVGRLLWYRFGNAGAGLLGSDELGLRWVGADVVEDWARRRFVRQNAAAWWSGPPPAGLRFTLPDGPPPAPLRLDTVAGVAMPSHLAWNANGVALSYLVERSAPAVLIIAAAARRAREVLRFERGLVYDVLSDYEPLDAVTAHVYMGADCLPADTTAVRDVLLGTLADIAQNGLTADELRRELRSYADSLAVPQAALGMLDRMTSDHVLGRPLEDQAALTAEYEAVTPALTAAALSASLGTMLLAAPGPAPEGWGFSPYLMWSDTRLDGREVKPAGWPLKNRKRKDRLFVGPDGVSWTDGQAGLLTVRYRDVVAYQHWDGDIRELRGADGFSIRLTAEAWDGGTKLIQQIDAAVPPEVIVCGEHNPRGMEDPAT